METFSALLDICAGNSSITGEFPAQRPVTRNFDVFFELRLNTQLCKQWWGWWYETPWRSSWRHYNVELLMRWLPVYCHVYILQVSPQLRCRETGQMFTWYKVFNWNFPKSCFSQRRHLTDGDKIISKLYKDLKHYTTSYYYGDWLNFTYKLKFLYRNSKVSLWNLKMSHWVIHNGVLLKLIIMM